MADTKLLAKYLTACRLCARNCRINRLAGERGACGMGSEITAARAALHFWEEPCLSGTRGSGTIFFTGCSLHCSFCQNRLVSSGNLGKEITAERLSEIFFELARQGAHNINLVTPTHFIPQITSAIRMAKQNGFTLPFICNCGGYESVEALKIWDGLIDIYLPDLKFCSGTLSQAMCGTADYFEIASKALEEMFRQTGCPVFDESTLMKKGMIVRHLMLPGQLFDTKRILSFLCKTYGNQIYISLMNQYTPPALISRLHSSSGSQESHSPAPDRPLCSSHYDAMVLCLQEAGQENAYIQEAGTSSESFIPSFDLSGL